jgi:hypothetical protein
MRTCLSFGLLICGNRDFFVNWGAEQVIRPESQNEAKGKLPEIKRLHNFLFLVRTGLVTAEKRLLVEREQE